MSPHCPYFGRCGGCQYETEEEAHGFLVIAEKIHQRIKGVFGESIACEIFPSEPSIHYRRRLQLRMHCAPEQSLVGFFAHGTRSLIPIDECLIAKPAINSVVKTLQSFRSNESGRFRIYIDDFDDQTHPRSIVRFEAAPASSALSARLKEHLAAYAFDEALVWCKEDRLFVDPRGFRQVNAAMNHVLRRTLQQKISRLHAKTMIDVYCGNGNLSLHLEGIAQRVFLESNKHQLAALHANLVHYGIDGDIIDQSLIAASRNNRLSTYDVVLVDPPRSGLGENLPIIPQIVNQTMFYVSCNPETLIPELAELKAMGFRVRSLSVFDMFPRTGHTEVLVELYQLNHNAPDEQGV